MNFKSKLTLNVDKLFPYDFEYIWNIEKEHLKYVFLFIEEEGFLDFKRTIKERDIVVYEKEKSFSYQDKTKSLYSSKTILIFAVCYLV